MIELIVVFILCRSFYRLAKTYHNTAKWYYVLSALITLKVWAFIGWLVFTSLLRLWQPEAIQKVPASLIYYITSIFGLLMCWIYYSWLQEQFAKQNKFTANNYWFSGYLLLG